MLHGKFYRQSFAQNLKMDNFIFIYQINACKMFLNVNICFFAQTLKMFEINLNEKKIFLLGQRKSHTSCLHKIWTQVTHFSLNSSPDVNEWPVTVKRTCILISADLTDGSTPSSKTGGLDSGVTARHCGPQARSPGSFFSFFLWKIEHTLHNKNLKTGRAFT